MLGMQALGRGGQRLALPIAALLGLLSALLIFIVLNQAQGGGDGESVPTTPVVVAKQDIPARTRVTAEMVELRPVPQDLVSPTSFTAVDQVVGKVVRFPIAARQQITADKLVETSLGAEAGRNPPLAVQVPPGKRAVAISASEETAVGGLVLPGDFVDVIGVFEIEDGQQRRTVSVVVVQNVQVLAVAQKVTELPPGSADLSPAERVNLRNASPEPSAKTMTLAVSPDQALALALAAEKGSLRVALRAFTDTSPTGPRVIPAGVPLPPEILAILALSQQ